jgi:hypothetical protein
MIDHATFRNLALSLPQAIEKPHFDRTSFRVDMRGGKIFATMPADLPEANLILLRDEQDMLLNAEPEIFTRVPNKWGDKGWTRLCFRAADPKTAESVLAMAWRHAAPAKLQKQGEKSDVR